MHTPEQINHAHTFLEEWLASRPLAQRIFDAADMGTLIVLLSDYGDARAAQGRDKIATFVESEAIKPAYAADMEHWHVGDLLSDLAAAIRALE